MKWSILACAVLLAGCANPYQQFYKGEADARIVPGYLAQSEAPRVIQTEDLERDRRELTRRGYRQVGYSSFEAGTNVTERQLIEQAEKIGAHVVLANSAYSRTDTGVVPITTPNNTTSYTSGSATAYGSRGGSATAYGNSTTTTYGTTTNYVPISVARHSYGAAYFAKTSWKLGVIVKAMTDAQRQELQSNTGLVVDIVVEDTPAFRADVLPGDILLSINGQPMTSTASISQVSQNSQPGQQAKLVLRRGPQTIEKTVTYAR